MTERIDLSRSDDPRDVVHRVVACLAQGGVVGLATESTYGLVAGALSPSAVDRLRHLIEPAPSGPPTLLLKGPAEVDDWAEVSPEAGRRLARRAWPGPVTLVFPIAGRGLAGRLPREVSTFLMPGGRIALRAPANRMVRDILRLLPGPAILVDPPLALGANAVGADDLASLDGLDMVVDVGPTQYGGPSTVVEVEANRWSVVRAGVMPEDVLAQMAGTILLFICTGNTCRSPMAEALCKVLLARRLGCEVSGLLGRGFVVLSAGVSAMDGMPAASHAVEAVKALGGSLADHESRRVAPDLVRHADHVIAMTVDHLDILLDQIPEAAPRARLLDAGGDDIDDPVGSDQQTYHRTAREIETHLGHLLDELGL